MARKDKQTEKRKRRRRIATPSYTKGYYRFSKDFPSVTDSEGYRDNEVFVNSPSEKASVRRRLIAVFVGVFIVTYVLTMLGFAVSRIPVRENDKTANGEEQTQNVLSGYNAVYLSGDVLSFSSAESIIGEFRMYGVDTVVIDFKDASGYFYFKPSITVSNEALYKASDNAKKIIDEFRQADISVIARVACFADDIYARNNQDTAAYVMTSPESGSYEQIRSMWYNGGTDSHAWLNPYSYEVQYYLRTVITDISALNVDGMIFDYAVLPETADADNVIFDGQSESENNAQDQMTSFILALNTSYLACRTGVVVPNDIMLSSLADSVIPDIVYSGCSYIVPDSRLSGMPDDTIIGNMKYTKPSVSPSEFTEHYIKSIYSLIASDDTVNGLEVVPLIEASDSSSVQIEAIAAAKGKSFIMYSSEMVYAANNF